MQNIDEARRASSPAALLGLDLAVELAAALESEEVEQRIPMRAAEAAQADRASLISVRGQDLVVEDGFDRDGLAVTAGLRTSLRAEPPFLRAFETRQAVHVTGPQFDGFPSARLGSDSGHVLILPLVVRGEVVGFLNLLREGEPPFNQASADTVQVIATVAAVNLRNARLLAEAQNASREMKNLLDVVVHELRSPLTVASGYVRMMRDGTIEPVPRAWGRPLEMVDEKLGELQRLVEELLLAARLESGSVPAQSAVVDLEALARRAVERAWPRALLVGATVSVEVPQGAVRASADPAHVDRILNNLVTNALDHAGQPAEVTLTVAHDGRPLIAVSDRGHGVPPAERERIFGRFMRGSGSTGSGLGLYLSRQLAEASGGSLDLDSAYEGPGARFVLRLPDPSPDASV